MSHKYDRGARSWAENSHMTMRAIDRAAFHFYDQIDNVASERLKEKICPCIASRNLETWDPEASV
jgi:hypothetical protein